MFSKLKNHPFAVEAYFDYSLVLTYAVPKEDLLHLIPECVQLDVFEDQYAFVAMALVQAKGLKPKGLPKLFGNDFFLLGFRVFVKYINSKGKRLRGLYILESATTSSRMKTLGKIFTHYNYNKIDFTLSQNDNLWHLSSDHHFDVKVNINPLQIILPSSSPFQDWKQARRYAGPLPFTFTYLKDTKEVLIIEGVRKQWKPLPVDVISHEVSFPDILNTQNLSLASAFMVRNIPYYWKKGKIEKWIP